VKFDSLSFGSGKLPIVFLAVVFLHFSCSKSPALPANDDPQKYTVVKDVLWASPNGFDLTVDIYTPNSGKSSYPVVVMFHGGGWLINDKSIMDQSSAYLATNSEYVICNVNYRLLSDSDNTVTLDQIVGDAFGAVLWIKDNISGYRGDGTRIAVTGDSAGGHLSAMIVNMGDRLGHHVSFSESLVFTPASLPVGKSPEQVAREHGLEVQAAILSYGAYDVYQAALGGFEGIANPFWLLSGSIARGLLGDGFSATDNPEVYKAVSPIYNIPDSTDRQLPPQLLTVGSNDSVVTPASVKAYLNLLRAAGQPAEYWVHEGRSHAFLDSGSNAVLGVSFEADAPPALDVMISFLDGVFY
jgi:acetyl esterase/lipase